MRKPADATKRDLTLQTPPLTIAQENAVDALVSGKNDAETAELVGVNRVTVTRWRLYSPAFQAALNIRRAEVWSVAAARLKALIPKALDALSAELDNADSPNRLKAATELLRLVSVPFSVAGPFDPEVIVRQHVDNRRQQLREKRERAAEGKRNDLLDTIDGLNPIPSDDELTAEVLAELAARTAGSNPG